MGSPNPEHKASIINHDAVGLGGDRNSSLVRSIKTSQGAHLVRLQKNFQRQTGFPKGDVKERMAEMSSVEEETDFDDPEAVGLTRYGDMLLDEKRNVAYQKAIEKVVTEMKDTGKEVHVLDIGTGTGLLAMMAARAGADRVIGLEENELMIPFAERLVDANDLNDKVEVFHADLNETEEGELELDDKANLIVAEVFDTELIGEGALALFAAQTRELRTDDCRFIPAKARIYITLLESPYLRKFSALPELPGHPERPEFLDCLSGSNIFEVQYNAINHEGLREIGKTVEAFCFDFEHGESSKQADRVIDVHVTSDGQVDGILFWWELDMDGSGQILLSTDPKKNEWRDHWLQAIHFLPGKCVVEKDQVLKIHAAHDEYSFSFKVAANPPEKGPIDRALFCQCDLHNHVSPPEIYRMNALIDCPKTPAWLEKICTGKKIVCAGESPLFPLLAAKYATKVYAVLELDGARNILEKYRVAYGLDNVELVEGYDDILENVDVLCFDPISSMRTAVPLNVQFWPEAELVQRRWPRVEIYPKSAKLRSLAMNLPNLCKTVGSVKEIQGFDFRIYDRWLKKARAQLDECVNNFPLWQYEGKPTSTPVTIFQFDFPPQLSVMEVKVKMALGEKPNSVALWLDWELDDGFNHSNGLNDFSAQDTPKWYEAEQGVYFIPEDRQDQKELQVTMRFNDGRIDFSF
ncbi:unnamed protein product, partial [Mesorhabditis spiculigera]